LIYLPKRKVIFIHTSIAKEFKNQRLNTEKVRIYEAKTTPMQTKQVSNLKGYPKNKEQVNKNSKSLVKADKQNYYLTQSELISKVCELEEIVKKLIDENQESKAKIDYLIEENKQLHAALDRINNSEDVKVHSEVNYEHRKDLISTISNQQEETNNQVLDEAIYLTRISVIEDRNDSKFSINK